MSRRFSLSAIVALLSAPFVYADHNITQQDILGLFGQVGVPTITQSTDESTGTKTVDTTFAWSQLNASLSIKVEGLNLATNTGVVSVTPGDISTYPGVNEGIANEVINKLAAAKVPKIDLTGAKVTIDLTNALPVYAQSQGITNINDVGDIFDTTPGIKTNFDLSWVDVYAKDQISTILAEQYSNSEAELAGFLQMREALAIGAGYDSWADLSLLELMNVQKIDSIFIETGIPGADDISGFYIYNVNGETAPEWSVDWDGLVVTYGNAPTPEPATMLIFGIGAAGLAAARLRKRNRK